MPIKKIAFITNSRVRSLNKLINSIKKTFAGDYQLKFFKTAHKSHAIDLTEQAVNEGYNYIICIGGDGSLNEVINGIMTTTSASDDSSRYLLRIGLLPNGTGNDFARTLSITKNIYELKKSIDNDIYSEVDIAKANFKNFKGIYTSRYFINITDVGIGGQVVQKLESSSKWMGSFLTFQRVIINTLLSYKKQQINVTADSFKFDGKIMAFAIANGKYFGGGLGIAPAAEPNDGKLEIVIVGNVSIMEYLRLLGRLKKCKRITHPELSYYSATEIALHSNENLPIDMDGEFIGYTPLTISIVPKGVKLLTPSYYK